MIPEAEGFRARVLRGVLPWLLVLVAACGAACSRGGGPDLTAETDEPQFRRGRELLRSNRQQEALVAFLNVIDKRDGEAPESHLEAGEIYLQTIKDPVAAIYHYRRFIELRQNSPDAERVRARIDTAMREFARTLPAQPLEGQVDRLDLLDQIAALQRENAQLKRELEARAVPVTPVPEPEPVVRSPPLIGGSRPTVPGGGEVARPPVEVPPGRTAPARYVVQPGDTLYKIATKVYGDGRRWQDILAANRAVIPNAQALRVGTELTIP